MARITRPQTHLRTNRTTEVARTNEVRSESVSTGPADRIGGPSAQLSAIEARRANADSVLLRSGFQNADLKNMREGVAGLYATYEIKTPLGRPRERFMTWAAAIEKKLALGTDVSSTTDAVIDKDIRRQVFLLEGILKLYKNEYPALEPHRLAVKKFEDTIGAHTAALSTLEHAKGIAEFPKSALKILQKDVDQTRKALSEEIGANWMPQQKGQIPAFAALFDALESLDFATPKQDRAFVRKEIARRIKKADKIDYNMYDLQGAEGLHDFRRDVRWIPIFVESLDGLVQLSERRNPIDEYANLLVTDPTHEDFVSDLADSKFVRLPKPDLDSKTVTISKSLYTANMKAVLDFGALKDRGEEIENLGHALEKAGLAPDLDAAIVMSTKLLGKSDDAFTGIGDEADVMYQEIVNNGLLKALRKEFD